MKCTIQVKYNGLLKFRVYIVRRGQIPVWAYNAIVTVPKYVHFPQVTLSYMKKGVVSQCNIQTTDVKNPETQESKAPQWRYAIADHAACTEIEGIVTWKQEAEGLSWLETPCQCPCFLLPSDWHCFRAGTILILCRKTGYCLVQGMERSEKVLRYTV